MANGKVEKNGKPKIKRHYPNGNRAWYKVGNPWAIKKGETRNPGGRPANEIRLLSDAYRDVLSHRDSNGISNADKIAMRLTQKAVEHETGLQEARELRQATEGDKVKVLADLTDVELRQFIETAAGRVGFSISGIGTQGSETSQGGSKPES